MGLVFLSSAQALAQVNISSRHAVFRGWQVSVSAPVFLGNGASSNLGLNVSNNFPIGKIPAIRPWLPNLSLGVSGQTFAPLDFSAVFVGANAGLGYFHRLGAGYVFDYGLRYAPLYRVGVTDGLNQGYQGVLANVGLHIPVGRNTFSTVGLQGGAYFTANGEPMWTLQPILGLNLNF